MQVLRARDYKVMPWKNGGGETTEIAVSPKSAGLADFDWRVSMAKVAGDGPFSAFPGIDRTLAILNGAGIVLTVEGDAPRRLTLESKPHSFPADRATSAALIGGTVIDFNVMSRRGRIAHDVKRLHVPTTLDAGTTRLILCSTGSLEILIAGAHQTLHARDCSLISSNEETALTPGPDSEFYVVTFQKI